MTTPEAEAERLLPCECGNYLHQGYGLHRSTCGIHKREAVASALAAKDAEIEKLQAINEGLGVDLETWRNGYHAFERQVEKLKEQLSQSRAEIQMRCTTDEM